MKTNMRWILSVLTLVAVGFGSTPTTHEQAAEVTSPDKHAVASIAFPRMPLGSSGTEHSGRKDRYDVIAFGPDGAENVLESR
jgi:hypothetical protein